MGRVKVKTKKLDIDLNDLNECFSQLTGEGDPSVDIVMPKYIKILKKIKQFSQCCCSTIELLKKVDDKRYADIQDFVNKLSRILKNSKMPDAFIALDYTDLIADESIIEIIEICGKFAPCYVHLEKTWDTVDKKFMNRLTEFAPLTFAEIDFRHLYVVDGDCDEEIQECVFEILKGMFASSYEIYKISSSPNVDKERIARIAIDAISKLRPMVPGCNEIFKKIERSATMFEGNFDSYYKDFIQSGDQTTIFTNFLSDIVKDNENSDIKLLFQCRKLIAFIRKNSNKSGNPQNDAMKDKILGFYDKISAIFDKQAKNDEENEGDDSDEDKEEVISELPLPDLDDIMAQIENPKIKSMKL